MQDIKKGNREETEGRELYGNSVLPVQFFCKPRTVLKSSIFVVFFFKAPGLGGARGLEFLGLSHSLTVYVIPTAQNTAHALFYLTFYLNPVRYLVRQQTCHI